METAKELLTDMQTLVDELKTLPQYAQYVKSAQLGLVDSRFAQLDILIKEGLIRV